jgi:hypothetical protein
VAADLRAVRVRGRTRPAWATWQGHESGNLRVEVSRGSQRCYIRGRTGPADQRGCHVYRPLSVYCRQRPAASFARSLKTAATAISPETLARSRRCAAASQAVQLIRGSGPTAAACCARRTQPGPRRPTAQLCTNFRAPRPPTSRPVGRPSRGPDQRVPVDPAPLCKHRQCGEADSRSTARRGCAPEDQPQHRIPRYARRNVRRRIRARCARTYWRTIPMTTCPGKSGHK